MSYNIEIQSYSTGGEWVEHTTIDDVWNEQESSIKISDVNYLSVSPKYFDFSCFSDGSQFFSDIFSTFYNNSILPYKAVIRYNDIEVFTGIIAQENCSLDYKTNIYKIRIWGMLKLIDSYADEEIDEDLYPIHYNSPEQILGSLWSVIENDTNINYPVETGTLFEVQQTITVFDDVKKELQKAISDEIENNFDAITGISVSGVPSGFFYSSPPYAYSGSGLTTSEYNPAGTWLLVGGINYVSYYDDGAKEKAVVGVIGYQLNYPGVVSDKTQPAITITNNGNIESALEEVITETGLYDFDQNIFSYSGDDFLNGNVLTFTSTIYYDGTSYGYFQYSLDNRVEFTGNINTSIINTRYFESDNKKATYRNLIKYYLENGNLCIYSDPNKTKIEYRIPNTTPIVIDRSDLVSFVINIDPQLIDIKSTNIYENSDGYDTAKKNQYLEQIKNYQSFSFTLYKDYNIYPNCIIQFNGDNYWVYEYTIDRKNNLIIGKARSL